MVPRYIYGLTDHERYVYHYTTLPIARDYILKNRTLRLGSFARTNDPKESKDWNFGLSTYCDRDLGKYNSDEVSRWLNSALKTKTKLACFSLDSASLTGDHTKDILDRGLARPRMWAQYADNHMGVCLVFDRSILLKAAADAVQSPLLWAGPVNYRNQSFVRTLDPHEYMIDIDQLETMGPSIYAMGHLKTYHQPLFFEKLLDWRDEQEWRIVAHADTEADIYISIQDALMGVIHGASMKNSDSHALFDLTESWTVEHMGLYWSNSCPWYDLGGIQWTATGRAIQAKLARQ